MNIKLFSLHWDNIAPEVVRAQKTACDALGAPLGQHRIDGLRHGEWIDWVLAREDALDVLLFIDVDCVPLSAARLTERFRQAAEGALVGAEGAANHLDPRRSYAGAWYVFINRHVWRQLGRPSAKETPYGDVCQLWTDTWRARDVAVNLIPPTHCETPKWNLPGRELAYGTATTYGDDCFHMFEARSGNMEPFLRHCRQTAAA